MIRSLAPWLPFLLTVATRLSMATFMVLWIESCILGSIPASARTFVFYGAVACVVQSVLRQIASGLFAQPTPDMRVTSETGSFFSEALSWSASGMRGWRDAMEDAHICQVLDPMAFPNSALFAVLDGHGGSEVSAIASKLLVREMESCGRQLLKATNGKVEINGSGRPPAASLRQALEQALPRLDAHLRRGYGGLGSLFPTTMHPFSSQGCTACVVGLDFAKREVVCANVGDSRAFLIRRGKAVDLSEDHKPENPEERNRIRGAGGQVIKVGPCHRVDGNLNLSRALGDFYLKANAALPPEKQKVIAVPDTQQDKFNGGPQELLVIACDGLFEKRSNQDVADLIWPRLRSGMALEQIGKEVLIACCARGCRGKPIEEGTDNESIVLVKLRPAQEEGAEGDTLCAGRRVEIHGLESEAGKTLNGQQGVLEGPSERSDRFEVCLVASGETKSLRASNLRVIAASD